MIPGGAESRPNARRRPKATGDRQIIVVGSTARVLLVAPSFRAETLGGSGFNIATAITAAGTKARLVTVVGTDLSTEESAALRRITNEPELRTVHGPTCRFQFRTVSEGCGPEIVSDFGVGEELTQHALAFSYEGRNLHVCCRTPLNAGAVLRHALLRRPATVSIDLIETSIVQKLGEIEPYLPAIDWAFLNEREYAVAAPFLAGAFVGRLVVTYGARGACVIEAGKVMIDVRASPAHSEVVDTTGAGDTLAGTFLGCLISGCNTRDALRRGVHAGTQAVTAAGVEAITRKLDCG